MADDDETTDGEAKVQLISSASQDSNQEYLSVSKQRRLSDRMAAALAPFKCQSLPLGFKGSNLAMWAHDM